MKILKIVLLTVVCLTTKMLEKACALNIEAKLKPQEHITLFFGGMRYIRLKNDSNVDSSIKADIVLRTLTEVRYSMGFKDGNQMKTISHTMLLTPNDSLVIGKNGYDIVLLNKKNETVFLDFTMKAGYERILSVRKLKITSLDQFKVFFYSEKEKLFLDSVRVDSLLKEKIIGRETALRWYTFSKITYYASIFQFVEDKRIKFDAFQTIDQSLYEEALKSLSGSSICISGNLTRNVLRYLLTYWRYRITTSKHLDIVDFYSSEREKIHPQYIYESLLGYVENATVKNTKSYHDLVGKIKKYANRYDMELYNKCITNRFFDMSLVLVTDVNKRPFRLDEIALFNGKKYLLLDMWASWCIPCREQLPIFHKFRKEMVMSDIAFVSISTDNSVDNWLMALGQENLRYHLNQFRLANSQHSELTKFFDLKTIPRYIIIENNGRVVSDRFYLPTDEEFKASLVELLKSN